MFRHDPGRTGASEGRCDIRRPAVIWRAYLGGSVEKEHVLAGDVNGDGDSEVVFLSAGRLIARRPDGITVWSGAPLELWRIDAVADLNGDGALEIVTTGRRGLVAIFDGSTGGLLWRTSPAFIGPEVGAVRVADLDGDGVSDLYVADLACGTPGSLGDVALAFSFARGFEPGVDDGRTHRLWQLERGRDADCGMNDVVADLDGDSIPEVVVWGSELAYVHDGASGARISSGDVAAQGGFPLGFPLPYGRVRTDVTDLDGDGAREIVGFTNNTYDPPLNSRAVFAASFDPSRPPGERFRVLWSFHAAAPDDTHAYIHDGVADLDGDGRAEVTTTFVHDALSRTVVLDGPTGEVLVELEHVAAAGVTPPRPDGRRALLVRSSDELRGYLFDAFASPPPAPRPAFTLPPLALARYFDRDRWAYSSAVTSHVWVTLPSGDEGLLLHSGRSLHLWDLHTSPPREVASHHLPEGVSVDAAVPQRDAVRSGDGALLVRSDGFLVVLDRDLRPINAGDGSMGLPGIRTGGCYSGTGGLGHAPVSARSGEPGALLAVRDSRGELCVLAPEGAGLSSPPRVNEIAPWVVMPLWADLDGDGRRELVARDERTVRAWRGGDFAELFVARLAEGSRTLSGDLVPLARGEGAPPLLGVVSLDSREGTSRVHLWDPADAVGWQSEVWPANELGPGLLSAGDLDGDGVDDGLVSLDEDLGAFAGADGRALASYPADHPRLVVALPGDLGPVTHLAAGSAGGVVGLRLRRPFDASEPFDEVWRSEPFSSESVFGALAVCSGGAVWITAAGEPSRVVALDLGSGRSRGEVFLADGEVFPRREDLERSGRLGVGLGNASATSELWPGQPGVVLGGADGWLYALDPCGSPPELLWTLGFGAPVGEVIFTDADGDGLEEIVVSVGDGFLYGVDGEAFPPPSFVYDIDPASGVTEDDVDDTYGEELAARWAEVEGARGYEWALLTDADEPVSFAPADPGNAFMFTEDLTATWSEGLEPGGSYRVAVRSVGPGGERSAEVLSDGTRYRFHPPEEDGGPEGDGGVADGGPPLGRTGCSCRAPDRAASLGLRWLMLL